MAEINPVPLRWLWPGVIPAGKLTLFVGDPGLGKSLVALDIAARVTSGIPWPDGSSACPIGKVILLSAEDDPADTIRPRLDAAGAISDLVRLIEGVRDGKRQRLFNLADDTLRLDAEIAQDTRLIIIDPITAYVGGIDSHVTSDVRGLLAPLAELAARRGLAILGVSHLNKGSGAAMYRTTGSLAWVAAARAVWAVGRDPENRDRILMLPVKQNLSPNLGGFAYGILPKNDAPCIAWENGRALGDADALLRSLEDTEDRSAGKEAEEWLAEALAEGRVKAADLFRQAHAVGISTITLRRAATKIGVRKVKGGFRDGWSWALPGAEGDHRSPEDDQGDHPQGMSTFGKNDHLREGEQAGRLDL
jgi:hypothetical protein